MGSGKYILDASGEPKLVESLTKWARWFEGSAEARRVARTQVGDCMVSTVFLGLDHNFSEEGPPVLWETMVFGQDESG